MSDAAQVQDVTEAPEGQIQTPEREPLPYEEMEKRYRALGRDVSAQRREIRELREALQRGPAPTQAQQDALDEGPDPDVDPIGFIKFARDYMNGVRRNEREQQKQQDAQNQQQAQLAQIGTRMEEFEADFRSDHRDYDDAAKHFREERTKELREQGVSEAELGNQLRLDLMTTIARAMRAGKDPADIIYKLAKNRGFGGLDAGEKKLDTIAKAATAGKSLSSTSGGARANSGEATFETVTNLSGKEFEAGWKALREQAKRDKDFR